MKIKLKMIRILMDKEILKIITQNQKKTDSSEKEKRYIS